MDQLRHLLLQARMHLASVQLAAATGLDRDGLSDFARSLKVAMPELDMPQLRRLYRRHRIAMRHFNLLKAHLSTLAPPQLERFLQRHVRIDDPALLARLRDDGKPVIFVTPHYGSFQLGCLKLIQEIGHHKTVNTFYNPPSVNSSSAGFEQLFQRLGYGFHALFNDDSAVLKALRVLRRGEALTMMPDVFDISGHALYVPFFGRLVPAMAGTALFALKSNATVVVGYSCPEGGLDSTVRLGQPLTITRSGDLDADIATLTAAILHDIEQQIRRAPEHWMYLPGIGELLQRMLPVSEATPQEWLQRLEAAAPSLTTVVPEMQQLLQELASAVHRPALARSST